MLKLRIAFVALLAWFAVLFNVERYHEPINLASFVYVLVALCAGCIISIPKLRRTTFVEIAAGTFAVYVALKWWLGYPFLGASLALTVTELVVVGATNLLAWRVAYSVDEFMQSAVELASVYSYRQPLRFEEGEAKLYEEVQRARRFERPLTVATVRIPDDLPSERLEQVIAKARREIARGYLGSRVSKMLVDATESGDLVLARGGEYILLFPEGVSEGTRMTLADIDSNLQQEFGISLDYGVAEFPLEELTLTGLMDESHRQMQQMAAERTCGKKAASSAALGNQEGSLPIALQELSHAG